MGLAMLESPVAARVTVDGKKYVNFAGSAYLGLGSDPSVSQAGIRAIEMLGGGMPLARSENYLNIFLQDIENAAAEYFEAPAAQYVTSGYFVPFVLLCALSDFDDVLYVDEFAHYAIRDAIACHAISTHTFRHCDAGDLSNRISDTLPAGKRPVVLTDGLFSVAGCLPPLDRYAAIVAPFGGRLIIDESHSFGVVGPAGRGACAAFGLPGSVAWRGGSLGKAFSANGGVVLGSAREIAACRAVPISCGASPGSPASAAMAAASLRAAASRPELLDKLASNARGLKQALRDFVPDDGTAIPIISLSHPMVPASQIRDRLKELGVLVYCTTYMGAPSSGVIRIAAFADHSRDDIDRLAKSIATTWKTEIQEQ